MNWEQVAAGFKQMGKELGLVDEQDEKGGSMKDKLKSALGNKTFEKIMKLVKAAE